MLRLINLLASVFSTVKWKRKYIWLLKITSLREIMPWKPQGLWGRRLGLSIKSLTSNTNKMPVKTSSTISHVKWLRHA
jgi:hypothetical protein